MDNTKNTHYDAGGIETIDILKAKLTDEQFIGFCLGNMIKYSTRANFKDQFVQDVEKVRDYAGVLLDCLDVVENQEDGE